MASSAIVTDSLSWPTRRYTIAARNSASPSRSGRSRPSSAAMLSVATSEMRSTRFWFTAPSPMLSWASA
jgi:hypothetical protein